jgi:hypothetical protein
MRFSDYILNPERLDDIVGYAIVLLSFLLSITVWVVFKTKTLALEAIFLRKKTH